MGHIEENGLRELQDKGMVAGMTDCTLDFNLYEHCIYGKQNRVRFPYDDTRAKVILELVHNDVFGPLPITSLGRSMYYISFIDDFSMNTWIYFLQKKYEIYVKFKEFNALVEN